MDPVSDTPESIPVSVIGPQFCVPSQFNIIVHPSSSGNLWIKDTDDILLLKVEPQNTTLHHQRVLRDVNDRFILTLREKHMTGHVRWNAFRGDSNADSDKLFTTIRSYMIQKKTGVSVFLGNATDECHFKIKGRWSQRRCAIYVGDSSTIIAQMRPMDAPRFMVRIQPNVDLAFVVALIAIVDAMKCSDRKDKIVANAKKTGRVIGGVLINLAAGAVGFALYN